MIWAQRSPTRRLLYSLAVLAALEAVDLVTVLKRGEAAGHGPGARVLEMQLAERHADVAHLAPVLAPGVTHDPVLALGRVRAPAHDADDMVHAFAGERGDARRVVEDRAGVDAARDRAARKDLLLHRVGAADLAEVADGGVRELQDRAALAARREGRARARDVLRRARPVLARADPLLRLRAARHVRVRRLVGDAGARLGLVREPRVRADDG